MKLNEIFYVYVNWWRFSFSVWGSAWGIMWSFVSSSKETIFVEFRIVKQSYWYNNVKHLTTEHEKCYQVALEFSLINSYQHSSDSASKFYIELDISNICSIKCKVLFVLKSILEYNICFHLQHSTRPSKLFQLFFNLLNFHFCFRLWISLLFQSNTSFIRSDVCWRTLSSFEWISSPLIHIRVSSEPEKKSSSHFI